MEQHLIYHGAVSPHGVRNVETLMLAAMSDGASRIVLHLCSGGGDVTAGIGLYNFIRAFPVRVDTHAFGLCGSIAATIFLAGEERTTVATGAFMLHAATFSDGPQKGQVSPNTALISLPFKERLGWDQDIIDLNFSDATEKWMPPSRAVELRIASSILDLQLPSDPSRMTNVALLDP